MNRGNAKIGNFTRGLAFYFFGRKRMLPAYIIDEIRRREERERERMEQPSLELPLPISVPSVPKQDDGSEDGKRGTIIIEL